MLSIRGAVACSTGSRTHRGHDECRAAVRHATEAQFPERNLEVHVQVPAEAVHEFEQQRVSITPVSHSMRHSAQLA